MSYTLAYTHYALKCLFDPATPNNDGTFRPIRVVAPESDVEVWSHRTSYDQPIVSEVRTPEGAPKSEQAKPR